MAQQKKKVFVSFDFDNDKTLKDFIIGQARNWTHHLRWWIIR